MPKKANIIVMGKTGAGKSTIVNAVLGEKKADTGFGQKITIENKSYSKDLRIGKEVYDFSIYDTVGLEIDKNVTEKTLKNIEQHMDKLKHDYSVEDVSAVWFCINSKCQRFEKYEIELLRRLSVDSCIPFIIVITQCADNTEGELERKIIGISPDIPVKRVLAEDIKSRIGVFSAYGIDDLLNFTVNEYSKLKVELASSRIEQIVREEREKNATLEKKARNCITNYGENAGKAGWIPGLCIPFVHGMTIKMLSDINKIYGINMGQDSTSVIADVIVGLIATPFMAIPLVSRLVTEAYVEALGEQYLNAVVEMVERHSNYKIENDKLIFEEIKRNLKKG